MSNIRYYIFQDVANFNKLAEEKNSVFRLKYIDCTLFLCTKDQFDNDDYIERL